MGRVAALPPRLAFRPDVDFWLREVDFWLREVDFWLREVDFWLREDGFLAVAREDLPRALVASRGLSLRLPLAFLRAAPEGLRVVALEPGEAVSALRVVPEVLREARLCAAVRSVLLICVPPPETEVILYFF